MLKVCVVAEELFEEMWGKMRPMDRFSAEWMPYPNMVIKTVTGVVIIMAGECKQVSVEELPSYVLRKFGNAFHDRIAQQDRAQVS